MGTLNTVLQEGGASLLRLDDILNKENRITTIKNSKSIKDLKGELIFKNISFNYENKIKSLDKINIKIRAKEKIVLVGANGFWQINFY